jgi:dienelactone hydrolase
MANYDMNTGSEPVPVYADKSNLLVYIDASGQQRAITGTAEWAVRRAHILANMQKVMGPLPDASFRVPLELEVIDVVELEKYTRKLIAYNVDPTDRVESYLLMPHEPSKKKAAIVALHQTTSPNALGKDNAAGLGGEECGPYAGPYAKELAERGYVVLAPDYWYYGHYHARAIASTANYDPYEKGWISNAMKGVWNHMRAIDVLETLDAVDQKRIGCIGNSLGGYNALFLAAFEPRIQAVVCSGGYSTFADYARHASDGSTLPGKGSLSAWGIPKHMPRITSHYDNDPDKVPFDFTELLGALAPRPLFTNASTQDEYFPLKGVRKCLEAAKPIYALYHAEDHLHSIFPEQTHKFLVPQRKQAYAFLDKHLGV